MTYEQLLALFKSQGLDDAAAESAAKAAMDLHTADVTGLKAKRDELLEKVTTQKSKLDLFGDVTPEMLENYRELLKKQQSDDELEMFKSGKFEEVFSQRMEKHREASEKQISELKSTNERLSVMLAKNAIASTAARNNVLPEALEVVSMMYANKVVIQDDGVFIVGEDGKPLLAADGKSNLTFEAALLADKEKYSYLFKKASGGGAGGGDSSPTNKKLSEMTEQERVDLFKENRPLYDKLNSEG